MNSREEACKYVWRCDGSTGRLESTISTSADIPDLLIAVLNVLSDIPNIVSSLHADCTGNSLQHQRGTTKRIRSIPSVFHQVCAFSQILSHGPVHSIATRVFYFLFYDTNVASDRRLASTMEGKTYLKLPLIQAQSEFSFIPSM